MNDTVLRVDDWSIEALTPDGIHRVYHHPCGSYCQLWIVQPLAPNPGAPWYYEKRQHAWCKQCNLEAPKEIRQFLDILEL